MKKYETPAFDIKQLDIVSVIAATFTESDSDNETSWLNKWTSGILGGNQ